MIKNSVWSIEPQCDSVCFGAYRNVMLFYREYLELKSVLMWGLNPRGPKDRPLHVTVRGWY